MNYIFRRILASGVIVAIGMAFFVLQHPSQSTESAVVFSNMPSNRGGGSVIYSAQKVAVIFDVPTGIDYQVSSLQTGIRGNELLPIVNARIHADGGALPGAVVVDLGSQIVPPEYNIITFTPVGNAILPNGGRYWLVLNTTVSDVASWYSVNPPIDPTGIFTFVDNGVIIGTLNPVFRPSDNRYNLIIDADPISSIPSDIGISTCVNVDGRENPVCEEPWQTAAIYCRVDGSIDVYGITDGEGWLAFRTTQSEIDAIGVPSENALLERSADGKIRLYRLSTGEFQVNAPMWDEVRGNLPDGYVFIWDGCP